MSTVGIAKLTEPDDRYGISVSGAGDVNGDGYDDVIVGAADDDDSWSFERGVVYVYLGTASGLSTVAATKLQGVAASDGAFGKSLSDAGDVDADGYDDIIVGEPIFDYWEPGMAHVFFGSSSGLSTAAETRFEPTEETPYEEFGRYVSGGGDFDGDGYDDLIVGAPGYNDDDGAAYAYLGASR